MQVTNKTIPRQLNNQRTMSPSKIGVAALAVYACASGADARISVASLLAHSGRMLTQSRGLSTVSIKMWMDYHYGAFLDGV